MRKTVFALALATAGLLAGEASAVTVLTTTQADVKKQCEGKTSCSTVCGSTYCNYTCDKPKEQCTVAVQMTKPRPGRRPHITGTSRTTR